MKPKLGCFVFLCAFGIFFSPVRGRGESALEDYRAGLELYQKCQYEKALERFQWAFDVDLNFWQSYQMAGYCFFYLREKENALSSFEQSLGLHPDNPVLRKFYTALKIGKTNVLLQPVVADSNPVPATLPAGPRLN